MNRYLKLPARFLLVLLGTILIAAGMTSVSLANDRNHFPRQTISTWSNPPQRASRSIRSCDDRDDNCTVQVSGTLDSTNFPNLTATRTALGGTDLGTAAEQTACSKRAER